MVTLSRSTTAVESPWPKNEVSATFSADACWISARNQSVPVRSPKMPRSARFSSAQLTNQPMTTASAIRRAHPR